MKIRVAGYDEGGLVLTAPFAPNMNHAGIAFGGAIECLATLACWGLVWLLLAEPDTMIVIQRGEISFHRPLMGELRAIARLPLDEELRHFRELMTRRSRARLSLNATVGDSQTPRGAEFRGRFAAQRQPAVTVKRGK